MSTCQVCENAIAENVCKVSDTDKTPLDLCNRCYAAWLQLEYLDDEGVERLLLSSRNQVWTTED